MFTFLILRSYNKARFFDGRNLDMLQDYILIQKIFVKYNIPLPVFVVSREIILVCRCKESDALRILFINESY